MGPSAGSRLLAINALVTGYITAIIGTGHINGCLRGRGNNAGFNVTLQMCPLSLLYVPDKTRAGENLPLPLPRFRRGHTVQLSRSLELRRRDGPNKSRAISFAGDIPLLCISLILPLDASDRKFLTALNDRSSGRPRRPASRPIRGVY